MLTVLDLIRIHYVDKVKQHWVNHCFMAKLIQLLSCKQLEQPK